MFQQLRFKLILINVAIIFLIFAGLNTGTYYFIQSDMIHRAEMGSRKLMEDIKSGNPLPLFLTSSAAPPSMPSPPPEFFRNVFYVKTDNGGSITTKPSDRFSEPGHVEQLVQKILDQAEPEGTVAFEETSYYYLKSSLPNQNGTVIVMEDLEHAKHMLHQLLTALSIAGVLCLALAFFSSAYMADKAMQPIKHALQQQKDFLSDASHELRTPLAVMQTNLDIVMDSPQELVADQQKWLNNIQEETTQMTKLINSLLFLARVDSHEQRLEQQAFDLSLAIVQTVESFKPLALTKGILLQVIADQPLPVKGDEDKIKQVVGILVDNALRHSPNTGKIIVELRKNNRMASLTVTDYGEGIPPEYLNKIFNRFFQVDPSRSKGGTGLGLAIAKWIVDSHGGSIQADSILGLQTTFTVRLPLCKGV